jgi:hypothetical protein
MITLPPPLELPNGATIRTTVYPSGNHAVTIDREQRAEPPSPEPRIGLAFYVPYTRVYPATVAGAPVDAVWVDVSSSANAYFGALYGWWQEADSFAVIEHDVVCRSDVVQAFEECPEPWCTFGYADVWHPESMAAWSDILGCTRFRAELIEAVPDAVSSISPGGWDWHNLSYGLGENLRAAGYTQHWHYPWVEHYHTLEEERPTATRAG